MKRSDHIIMITCSLLPLLVATIPAIAIPAISIAAIAIPTIAIPTITIPTITIPAITIPEVKTRYNFGILFIPEGKYLLTKTIDIPAAIRVIGYGKDRPLFQLGQNSPGFQTAGARSAAGNNL